MFNRFFGFLVKPFQSPPQVAPKIVLTFLRDIEPTVYFRNCSNLISKLRKKGVSHSV